MPQMFDPKDGLPKLSEGEVPVQQQLIDAVCKSAKQRKAAQSALDARDIRALEAALWHWRDADE